MARKPVRIPDYFTTEEAQALVAAAPSYPVKMAMRVMLRTGLRVSECLSLKPADLRFNQDPPIISLRPEVTGNKAKRGREVPIPADLASSLSDMVSMRPRKRPPASPLQHLQAVGQQVDERSGRRGGPGPGTGPSPCPPAHLRAECGPQRRPDAGAPAMAGPPLPGRDGTLRPVGRWPP